MACKVQLIDTSDTFLDNSSSYLGAMPYLAQMMVIATPSSGRQIDILVGKWYKINAPLTSWWWGASVTTVWVGNIILMFTRSLWFWKYIAMIIISMNISCWDRSISRWERYRSISSIIKSDWTLLVGPSGLLNKKIFGHFNVSTSIFCPQYTLWFNFAFCSGLSSIGYSYGKACEILWLSW